MDDLLQGLDSELASLIDLGDPETNAVIFDLAEKRKTEQLLSGEIRNQSLDFLIAKPDKLKAMLMRFPELCRSCRESGASKAAEILEAIVDRYTQSNYIIDCDTMTFIGIHLKKNGYTQEAVRCFKRAGKIISE